MGKRLEVQLEELNVKLVAAKQAHAALLREHAAKITAAKRNQTKTEDDYTIVNAQQSALIEKIEREGEIVVITKRDRDGDVSEWKWHPDFLARVAAVVGVHYKDRSTVDPKNQHDSLYEKALWELRRKLVNAYPEVVVVAKAVAKASNAASASRSALWSAEQPTNEAQRAVRYIEREIEELERKIKSRNYEKQEAEAAPKEAADSAAAEEAAKAARAKLRLIIEGKLTLEPKS